MKIKRKLVSAPMGWSEYYLRIADQVSKRSKDPNTKVGAIIVAAEGTSFSIGYNGFPRGVRDYEDRWKRPLKYTYVTHAEKNAILNSDLKTVRNSPDSCIYITHYPCSSCVKDIIQAGIKRIVTGGKEFNSSSEMDRNIVSEMLKEANISYQIIPNVL